MYVFALDVGCHMFMFQVSARMCKMCHAATVARRFTGAYGVGPMER